MAKKAFGNTSKWVEGIKTQLDEIEHGSVNTQYINIEQVILDPNNPRVLNITLDEIRNGPKLPDGDFNENNQKIFENEIINYFNNTSNNSHNQPKIKDYFELAMLAASIKSPDKLVNPITVYMGDNMQFNLIAGHRRTFAHYIMGSKKICARILTKKPTNLDKNLLQWSENQDRDDLTLLEQLTSIKNIIFAWENENNSKITLGQLISLLSLRKTRALWFLKLYRSHDTEILDLINKGYINSLETAYKILTIDNKKERDLIIKEIISGNIKNAKAIPIKSNMVRRPNHTLKGSSAHGFDGRAKIKSKAFDINIKTQDGFNFFQLIIKTLNKSSFYSNLMEKDKYTWNEIIKYFNEVKENA
jgi:hypothetical protein